MRMDLNGAWILLDEKGNQYQAKVPGCVHTDLIKEDMYWRDNYEKYTWIEECDWVYQKTFELEEKKERMSLVFEGLDTYCDVFLNDIFIGHAENMFVPHRFAVDHALCQGMNELKVHFYSPIRQVADKKARTGAFTTERMNTRRMQCTYGWDWVARFVTCGIIKPVALVSEEAFGVEDLYIYTGSVDAHGAEVCVKGSYRNYAKGSTVELMVCDPKGETVYKRRQYVDTGDFAESITIPKPELWYPAGYGEQPLYTLLLKHEGGVYETKFGIRTVRIMENQDQPEDRFYQKCEEIKKTDSALEYDENEEYKGFTLLVNGVKILCMGANYVPVEPFVSEETEEKITKLLEMARAGGVNMVRIWGGGHFERDFFYSECDRLGLMVIQDFLMACGSYPEDEEWFLEQLTLETEYAAKLLRNHPCLMWWHGDNENAVNGCDMDKQYPGRTAAYQAMLPVLNRWDYTRRFLPSSPYGGKKYASKTVGTTHNTQYLSYIFDYIEQADMKDYKEYFDLYTARFISEEPAMGAASEASLLKMMTKEDIYAEDMAMWYHHTKSNPATKELLYYMLTYAEKVFGTFTDAKDRYFKLRYLQYEQIRISFENYRKQAWFCSGLIYWMLNDCWPAAAGWALIDYYNAPKASYYSFQRAARQVIASVDKTGMVLSNRGMQNKMVQLKYRKINYRTNEEELLLETETETAANECTRIDYAADVKAQEILVCDLYGETGLLDRCFYKEGSLALYPCGGVRIVGRSEGMVYLKADTYVHVVELLGDAVFSDNYFSMVSGEERAIACRCTTGQETDIELLTYSL